MIWMNVEFSSETMKARGSGTTFLEKITIKLEFYIQWEYFTFSEYFMKIS